MHSIAFKNATPISLYRNPQFAAFHSTPNLLSKWKSKWPSKGEKGAEKPSKTFGRYAVRQKRAEIKKALKDYLLFGKSSNLLSQVNNISSFPHGTNNFTKENRSYSYNFTSTTEDLGKAKPHDSSYSRKAKNRGSKCFRKKQKIFVDDEFDNTETVFENIFGEKRSFNWSSSWERFFNEKASGYERAKGSRWQNARSKLWSESEIDEESDHIGLHSERITLGLPSKGPLQLDDVKTAFRKSALIWHPDKHQGPSQAMAAEKFKLCADAYNSLCNVLKAT